MPKPNVNPSILKNKEEIDKVDQANVYGSIEVLTDQIHQAWEETQQIEFEPNTDIKNVVVAGMGGSGLGADVVKHLFKEQLKVPLEVVNSYSLPGYVDQHSLVILSSYSGNTEEVLNCAAQAKDQRAQRMVITSGGQLVDIAQQQDLTVYQINAQHNPSQQPRMAIGYAIFGLMGLLNQAGIITLTKNHLEEASKAILATSEDCRLEADAQTNPAKSLAFSCVDRRPILVTSEFLNGAAHVSTNQFNENAKTFADYKVIPEINHHLLEALQHPTSNKLDHYFICFYSQLYHQRNQQRMSLTQKAVNRTGIENLAIHLQAQTKMGQVFEMITLMAYTNFYLAMLYQIDPSLIPMVDWFKSQLKE